MARKRRWISNNITFHILQLQQILITHSRKHTHTHLTVQHLHNLFVCSWLILNRERERKSSSLCCFCCCSSCCWRCPGRDSTKSESDDLLPGKMQFVFCHRIDNTSVNKWLAIANWLLFSEKKKKWEENPFVIIALIVRFESKPIIDVLDSLRVYTLTLPSYFHVIIQLRGYSWWLGCVFVVVVNFFLPSHFATTKMMRFHHY